jgi:hypothetical protein
MAVREDNLRYNLPVETFIRQLLKERYPKLNTAPGSAIYDLIITPAALIQQSARDRAKVIQRNQSIANFGTMLPEEMDRLASNFFVERSIGSRATGVQRLYFPQAQDIFIDTSVLFLSDDGLIFRPISPVILTSEELALNVVAATNEFYVDVPVISENIGARYSVKAGSINRFSGIPGATRTVNPSDFFGGADPESNGELYVKIKNSLASREPVKSTSIKSLLLNQFDTVQDVIVQGYGDPYMHRDRARIVLSIDDVIPASFCKKLNLPLNLSGDVEITDDDGNPVVAPMGGFAGAVVDLSGVDFNNVQVQLTSNVNEFVPVQPGFRVKFSDPSDLDYGISYRVRKVVETPIEVGGESYKVLLLDRSLKQTNSAATPEEGSEYRLQGFINSDAFHIGGKVDVYIKSSGEEERSVIVGALPATVTGSNIAEVPVSANFLDSDGVNQFVGAGFSLPAISIVKIEQLDPISDDVVIRTLIPDVHYKLIRAEIRGAYTLTDYDVVRIEGEEEILDINGDPTGTFLPLFIGERIKITYLTNPDINLIQTFMNLEANRDITKDMSIKSPDVVFVNTTFRYSGNRPVNEISDIVRRYINSKKIADVLTVNELVTVLTYFGVTDIEMPLTLTSRKLNADGTVTSQESVDRLELEDIQIFKAESNLSISQI